LARISQGPAAVQDFDPDNDRSESFTSFRKCSGYVCFAHERTFPAVIGRAESCH
jgi:hypothetical protein